eukprot:CAMPEP_0176254470 /NCGR_PEP_ID=MMETSP0121_2-20121125/36548_1 /TAXON_ID=160619 /ORGANISM="Kryptoperidinium foliaceum, Strain CCMP 1326" /LENGTH=42 /DNA_ID= /DNA_START= /DNA_END= /DNA_ORIENTATION=
MALALAALPRLLGLDDRCRNLDVALRGVAASHVVDELLQLDL